MKLARILGCLLAVVPLGVAAQNGGANFGVAGMEGMQSGATGTIFTTGPNGQASSSTFTAPNACPVSMQASHLSDGSMIRTGPAQPQGAHPKDVGQRLHLTLFSPDQRAIASAVVKVRGWTARSRMERASTGPNPSVGPNRGQTMRTLTVRFTAGENRSATADLWAPGLTAVSSIELWSVAFTDGSSWEPANGSACRVSPDPIMPITGK